MGSVREGGWGGRQERGEERKEERKEESSEERREARAWVATKLYVMRS